MISARPPSGWRDASRIRRPLRDPPVQRSRSLLTKLIQPLEIDSVPGTPTFGAWGTTETLEELLARS